MNPFRKILRTRSDSERGATLILVAVSITMLLAASGMSVDLGRTIVVNRGLQSVADASALDTVRYIGIKAENGMLTTLAQTAATQNGSNASTTVVGGVWSSATGFTAKPLLSQCAPTTPQVGPPPCNAVRVTAASPLAHLFSHGSANLHRTAIAAVIPEAGFSIGTYLGTYSTSQAAILNVLLGKLGTSANLSALSYAGLANTDVSIQQLINASGSVLTPTNVMTTSLSSAQWVLFLKNAVSTQAALLSCGGSTPPAPCAALTALGSISSAMAGSTPSATLCNFMQINTSSTTTSSCTSNPQLSQAALTTNLNVLQTLTSEAEFANGTNALDVTSALGLPLTGLTLAKLTLNVIQYPQIAYGPVNTTAQTAQVSATLSLSVPALGTISIPLSAASGTATLSQITCVNNVMSSVKIATTTSAITAAITGTLIPAGASLSVNGVGPVALGFSNPLAPNPPIVPPTSASIAAKTNPQYVGTTAPSLTFNSALGVVDTPILSPVLTPIFATLQAFGLSIAGAQVAVLSANCGAIDLEQ
jgi:uncharacterized membrane protein